MTDLVFLKGKQALTDSLTVAEYFEKRHDTVLRAIENAKNNLRKIADVEKAIILSTYVDAKGEKRPMYLLNRDGFIFVAMKFTGTKAAQWQWDFIQAFNAMEQILLNQQNEQWRAIREAGKQGNRQMCDAVHDYIIPLARAKGSTTPDERFYQTYQKAVNRAAGIKAKSRDAQSLGQLYEVEKLQQMVEVSIKGQAARGEGDYKKIYRDTDALLQSYSRISLIPARFLSA